MRLMPPVVSNSLKSVCHTIGNVGRMNPCLAQGCDGFVSESPLGRKIVLSVDNQ
jgi:hypothetical protein